MSVNASILHFEKDLNATVYLGLTGHQGNKAENAALFFFLCCLQCTEARVPKI